LQNDEVIIIGADVVEEAYTWMGTPFVHQAASKGFGCDCIGMVRGVGRDLDIFDFDENSPEGRELLSYSLEPEPRRLIKSLNYYFFRVRAGFENGDVVLFAIQDAPTHVAIVSDVVKGVVIHTWRGMGRVIETRYGDLLRPTGVWRYPDVACEGE